MMSMEMENEMKFRSQKEAEFEILKLLLNDSRVREIVQNKMRSGVRGTGRAREVCRMRADNAMTNIAEILRGMKDKRIKHLPEHHIDFDSEGEDPPLSEGWV
jgi:hypothetical protein